MNQSLKKFIPLALVTILILGIYLSGALDYISLETIKEQRLYLMDLVNQNPVIAGLVFMIIYIATVALSLPIASLMTLLGGFLFGLVAGTLMVVTSAAIGASLIFLVAKSAIGESLRDRAGPFYNKVADNMNDNAIQYMFFMRLVPILPFFVANVLPALFNIKLRDFLVTTFLGIIPGTIVYVNIGQELATIESLGDLISPQILGAFTLLGLFALIPTFIKLFKKRKAAS
jgi:uncharacterized membrane protein YdjX (TVP38/TMEM64 family)